MLCFSVFMLVLVFGPFFVDVVGLVLRFTEIFLCLLSVVYANSFS